MFHRLTVPTYFGGLPAGADYLNTPSDVSVGGTGVPATYDGKKSGGPNDGTYLHAFGEDATSDFLNRGLAALGENTDELDDYLHRDLAVPVRTGYATAASPISSIVLTGQIFVGASGTVNNESNRDMLFSVLDGAGNEILDATGVSQVRVGLAHDGSSNNVVGTAVSGFRNGVTLQLTYAIPAGTIYYVVYGERGNLSALPVDALTSVKIRAAQEASAEVERLFVALHGNMASSFAWNDPFPVSLNGLLRGGLDARYRNSSAELSPSVGVDQPGVGATITRDGRALTFACPNTDLGNVSVYGARLYDPLLACVRVQRSSTAGAAMSTRLGGDIGIMQESPFAYSLDYTNERAFGNHVTGPLLLDTIHSNFGADTLNGTQLATRISTDRVARLNPDADPSGDGLRTIQVGTGDYLNYAGVCALRTTDLLEVTLHATGEVLGTFRVDVVDSIIRVRVRSLAGSIDIVPGVPNVSTQVRLRWLQPTLSAGGHMREFAVNTNRCTPHFMVAAPAVTVASSFNAVPRNTHNAMFLAAVDSRYWGTTAITNDSLLSAMAWGGFSPAGTFSAMGVLQGDGGIICQGGRQSLNLVNKKAVSNAAAGSGTLSVVYVYGSSALFEYHLQALASTSLEFIFTVQGMSFAVGDEFEFVLHLPANMVGPLTMVWPSSFRFSGSDGTVPTTNPTASIYTIRYRFSYLHRNGAPGWFAVRTDYLAS